MGSYCCGCCDESEETPKILAEYDPLMTRSIGENLIESVNSERADLLIECTDQLVQRRREGDPAHISLSMLRNMTTSQFVTPILVKAEYVTVDE